MVKQAEGDDLELFDASGEVLPLQAVHPVRRAINTEEKLEEEQLSERAAFLKMIRKKRDDIVADVKKNGLTAQQFDQIDAYRTAAGRISYNALKREMYRDRIAAEQDREVREYRASTESRRKEQKAQSRKKTLGARSPDEIERQREVDRQRKAAKRAKAAITKAE